MVDQLRSFADERLLQGCIYCGGLEATREHVPSRVFLEAPFPENLPVVAACLACNNGFSSDEEYVACLIECASLGSTDPSKLERSRIAKSLNRSPALRGRIESSRRVEDGRIVFEAEVDRVDRIVSKLARGHAAFELSEAPEGEPSTLLWWPRSMMTPEQMDNFDAAHVVKLFGEVGSRSMQRLLFVSLQKNGGEATANLLVNDWVFVQDGRYRYLAISDEAGIVIRLVIAEFLAAEVRWNIND